MKQKNLWTVLLALCLVLTACGKEKDPGPDPLAEVTPYTTEVSPCTLPMSDLSQACVSGGAMFLAGTVMDYSAAMTDEDGYFSMSSGVTYSVSSSDGEGGMTYGDNLRAVLCRIDTATGKMTPMPDYAPESGTFIGALAPGKDGSIWVLEQTMPGLEGLDPTQGREFFEAGPSSLVWRNLSADGSQELARVDVPAGEGGATPGSCLVDPEGRLYLASGSTVTVLDGGTGNRFTCNSQDGIVRLVSLADGTVGALTASVEGGRTIRPIDPKAKNWGTSRPLTGNGGKIFAGNEAYEFFYISGDSLYGWPKGGDGPERMLSWSGAGVDCGQVYALAFLADGRGSALLYDSLDWSAPASTALLSPADPEIMANRKVLTLATMGLSRDTRARAMEFNRTNTEYRIEIQDYSEFNTADDVSAGLSKLNTEILAGKMPDLLDVTDALPLRQYAKKGYLEDLWPYIESDPDLGREAVMERALQSAEVDGKLYQVFPSFWLQTLAGAPSAVGDKTGWSLADMKAAMAQQPPDCGLLDQNETRASVLENLFADNLDQFVDWDSGTAHFDSPEFREILEFCASFPAQPGTVDDGLDKLTRAAQGGQLLLKSNLLSLPQVMIDRGLFGGQVTFVGYPGVRGSGARFLTESGLALSSACQEKEAAWDFLRKVLLPTGEDTYINAFPINREDFDRAAAKDMKVEYVTDEHGEPVTGSDGEPIVVGEGSYVYLGGLAIPMGPVPQEDYDQFMGVYNNAESLRRRDENLWTIVQECTGPYFAGDKRLEETAEAIQNRAALYVNEQK